MKIALYSDLHLECRNIRLEPKADLVVLAGDIWTKDRAVKWTLNTFDGEIVYVLGNHEYYGSNISTLPEKIKEMAADHPRLHVLNRDELMLPEHGVRILGCTLWTDFKLYHDQAGHTQEHAMLAASHRIRDFDAIRIGNEDRKFLPKDALEMHFKDRCWLESKLDEPFDGKTVVVTHHAPSANSIPPEFQGSDLSPAYASNLEHLLKANLWLHGHTHRAVDYQSGSCRVVCNPRGYESYLDKEDTEWDQNLIIEV